MRGLNVAAGLDDYHGVRCAVAAGLLVMVVAACQDPPADLGPVDAAVDAAVIDADIDAESIDAAAIDAVPIDAVLIDAAPIDAAPIDAAPIDAAPIDAAPIDAVPIDAVLIDAGVDAVPGPVDLPACALGPVVGIDGVGAQIALTATDELRACTGYRHQAAPFLTFLVPWDISLDPGAGHCRGIVPVDDGRLLVTGLNPLRFVLPSGAFAPTQLLPVPVGVTAASTHLATPIGGGSVIGGSATLVGAVGLLWRLDAQAVPLSSFGTGGVVTLPEQPIALSAWPPGGPPTRLYALGATTVTAIDPGTGAILSIVAVPVPQPWQIVATADDAWVLGAGAGDVMALAPLAGGPATPLGVLNPSAGRAGTVNADPTGRLMVVVPKPGDLGLRIVRVDPARFDGVDPATRIDPSWCGGELLYSYSGGPPLSHGFISSAYPTAAGDLAISFSYSAQITFLARARMITVGLP